MKIEVPYGDGRTPVVIDDASFAGAVHAASVVCADERELLADALAHPVSSPTLEAFLDGVGELLVIVNDSARPTPTARVLRYIAPMLARVPEVRFIVATGTHRAPTPGELGVIFGDLYPALGDRVLIHDARDKNSVVHVGTTSDGNDVLLNRHVVQAEHVLIIGSVEPHYFAGYTGGRKAFLPGTSAYETVARNHKHALHPGSAPLALEGNPVHEGMVEAVGLLGDKSVFSIQTVVDSERSIYAVTAGDIHESLRAAIEKGKDVFAVEVKERAEVVVAVATAPLDANLYQAHKAIEHGKLALKDGGVIILVAECGEGLGPDTFVKIMSAATTTAEAMEKISGQYELGYQKVAKLVELMNRAEIWAVTGLPDATIESVFFRPVSAVQDAVDAALEKLGPDARVLFLMQAAETVPVIK